METNLILYVLQNDKYTRKYDPVVIFRDQIPLKLQKNRIYIVHSATSKTRPSANNIIAGHVFVIDTLSPNSIVFFDSFGQFETLRYKKLIRILKQNSMQKKNEFKSEQYSISTSANYYLRTSLVVLCAIESSRIHTCGNTKKKIFQKFDRKYNRNSNLNRVIASSLNSKKEKKKDFF